MMGKIIDGKELAARIRENLTREVAALNEAGKNPGLAVIIVGDNPASQSYVRAKTKACQDVGMYSELHELDASISETDLLTKIEDLNQDSKIHGILVQLPLPAHIDEHKVIEAISADKDVDGFHVTNAGRLLTGLDGFVACTPAGVIEMIKSTGVSMVGQHVVVVGRSNIVGKPVAILALNEHATVTICHSRTRNLAEITRQADILIAAVGRPEMITGDMVKEGSIIIDVGINRVDGKLVGDVDFASCESKAAYISPVPGGVGPMTITMLLANTVQACKNLQA